MRIHHLTSFSLLLAAAIPLASLIGCGTALTTSVTSTPTVSAAPIVTGRAMGGQQPLAYSTIQLYAINTTTLRGASASLLTKTVTTDANGYFNITGLYPCTGNPLVYLTATQGTVGTAANNASIALMAALGPCSSLNSGTIITMNELTTVASAYALAPFAADIAHIGAPPASLTGITNAFATVNSLVNTATGQSPGLSAPAGATIPSTELNTLADIIADCVNTDTPSSGCSPLFTATTPSGSGSPVPADTVSALLNIAASPSANVTALFNLQVAQAPFVPKLSTAPADWSVAIRLTGSALSAPNGIAIDASGNAWVTNESGNSLSEFSPQGTPLSGVNGFGSSYFRGAQGITIDPAGAVWIANTGANTVIKLNANGSFASPNTGYALPSFSAPVAIAADARNNLWVANFIGNSISEITSTGTLIGSPLTASSTLLRPTALAIDPTGNLWISNSGQGTLTEYSKTAALLSSGNGFTDNALQGPAGLATDSLGNIWVAGQGGGELSAFASTGVTLSTTPVFASIPTPTGVATDANGSIWITSGTAAGTLSKFAAATGAAIPSAQSFGTLSYPAQIAVDPSGNLWTANSGDNSVSIFIGLAAPTLTPLVARTQ